MSFIEALIGAIVGAGIGFFAVWWQHRAQKRDRIRAACAELIFLGDQCEEARESQSDTHVEALLKEHAQRLAKMQPIVRYLELSASDKLHDLAKKFVTASGNIRVADGGGMNPGKARPEYTSARAELTEELRK